MSSYTAVITWEREGANFSDNRYSRAHRWTFDGGITVAASSSPHVVPAPMSRLDAVDPEEAFVASLSSCHMLTFLWIAARRGFVVERYHDEAVGELEQGRRRRAGDDVGGAPAARRVRRRAHAGRRDARGDAPRGARAVLHRSVGEDGCRCEPVAAGI
jgi:organic hydroperoxide reductase OsmC/OhrA